MADTWFSNQLQLYGPEGSATPSPALSQARVYCRRLARQHTENFIVASLALPPSVRPHFHSVYAFCRWADDLADELDDPRESLRLLDWWEQLLENCYQGKSTHPVFVALTETIREFSIPIDLPRRLLNAFRQDQRVTRYQTFEDLLSYCHDSANPVGELILLIGRCHDRRSVSLSDKICTGLQLTNFWQDVERDYARGRIYIPREAMELFGCDARDVAQPTASPAFRRLVAHLVDGAEQYFRDGESLVQYVPTWLRVDVHLFLRGGMATLQAIRRADCDVLRRRPKVSRFSQLGLLLSVCARLWRAAWHGRHLS